MLLNEGNALLHEPALVPANTKKIILAVVFMLAGSAVCRGQNKTGFLSLADFGILNNSATDIGLGLQNAIDSAAKTGSSLYIPPGVYNFERSIHIPAGVRLTGTGMGGNALTRPLTGSVLSYTGIDTAVIIEGSNCGVENLSLQDKSGKAKGGLIVFAQKTLLENTNCSSLNIYGFIGGTALGIYAADHGGIGYSSFYNVHIRNAKTGIEISQDSLSFVNSNTFINCSVSGGGYDYGLLVKGGDNNSFYDFIIEPYSSVNGHLVVEKGQITGENIRIEALRQKPGIPVIYFGKNTALSKLTGFYAGGLVVNQGNNLIDIQTSNYTATAIDAGNLFINSSFLLPDKNGVPAFWKISDSSGITIHTDEEEMITGQKVIVLKIPPQHTSFFMPAQEFIPVSAESKEYNYINIGVLIKTNFASSVILTAHSDYGVVSSVPYSGSGDWETLSLQAINFSRKNIEPKINFFNKSNDTLTVKITAPSFTTGFRPAQQSAGAISGAGGIITGTLSIGVTDIYNYSEKKHTLVLPHNGNIFSISEKKNILIENINPEIKDRFAKGTFIILLFDHKGYIVKNNFYLHLKEDFISSAGNTSLTLVSMGDRSWRELSRNN